MLGLVGRYRFDAFKILEPSAGQGHILDLAKENFPNAEIMAIEQNPMHCQRLREKGYFPINDDFMNVVPVPVDLVLMNPPFTYQFEHIRHAYEFLADGGQLISVASGNILAASNYRKSKDFKEWFDSAGGSTYTLPAESFKESGTTVNTILIMLDKERGASA
jgi:predicted RNA methylase